MKVLIIGASGLVGSNCKLHFEAMGWEVKGTYFSFEQAGLVYCNTLVPEDSRNFDVIGWAPDIIVHCGALTHVDKCELEPQESFTQTVQSTLNLIAVANACNAKMVYLSTDYVFDGTQGPYTEEAIVNPLSVYGKHKLQAEQEVLNNTQDALVLRVTNIYGNEARGKNFVARIVSQCLEGKELTLKLPYDQFASPTNAMDIARVMYLLLRDGKQGIYHVGSTDYMNRVSLAQRILKYFPSAKYQLDAVNTITLEQPAARPLKGGFVTAKLACEYPEFEFTNLDDYLKQSI